MFDQHEPERSEEEQLPAELAALERQLGNFMPVAPRLDRDRLMFEAGRPAAAAAQTVARTEPVAHFTRGHGYSHIWPIATAAMTAACVVLATMLVWQSPPAAIERQVAERHDVLAPSPPRIEVSQVSYTNDSNPSIWFPWPWSGPPTSGYLATRYSALTFGLSALDSESARVGVSDGVNDSPQQRPATARELLQDFLPAAPRRLTDQI